MCAANSRRASKQVRSPRWSRESWRRRGPSGDLGKSGLLAAPSRRLGGVHPGVALTTPGTRDYTKSRFARQEVTSNREADISTEPASPPQGAWIPEAHVHASGPGGIEPSSREGAQTPGGVAVAVERLRSRRDFSQTFHRGQTFTNRLLVIFVQACTDETTRVGYTSARSAGGAVRRNRIRRRLRAAVAGVADRMRPGRRIVILGKTGVLGADWRDVTGSLETLLRRAGCLEDS